MTRNLDSPASTVAIEIAGNPGGIAYMSLQQLRDVLLEAELLDNAYVNLNPPSHAAAN